MAKPPRTTDVGHRRGTLRRNCAVVAAIAVIILSLPSTTWAGESGLTQQRVLPTRMIEARRHLEIDASARRLFEIGQPEEGSGMDVVAYDLDTLKLKKTISIEGAHSGYGGRLSAVDEAGHRLFVLYPVNPADDSAVRGLLGESSRFTLDEVRTIYAIAVIDTRSLRVLARTPIPEAQPAIPKDDSDSNFIPFKAMNYFAGEDKLYLTTELPVGSSGLALSSHSVFVHQLDVKRLVASSSALDWSYPVAHCAKVTASDGGASVVLRSSRAPAVFVPCRSGSLPGGSAQPLETPGIVRVSLTPRATAADIGSFTTEFFPFSGNLKWGLVSADRSTERLFVQSEATITEPSVWVFDTVSSSWLGYIVLPDGYANGHTAALAIDEVRGRLYTLSTFMRDGQRSGYFAILSATRAALADQGLKTDVAVSDSPMRDRAVVDPIRRRIFMRSSSGYVVLRDRTPNGALGTDANPDDNTMNIEESAQTAVNFLSATQAFGSRIKWVGGAGGLEGNLNPIYPGFRQDFPPPEEVRGQFPPDPAPGTRDIHLGRVISATLANGEASAKATGADRDAENTDNDLASGTAWFKSKMEQFADMGGPDYSKYGTWFIQNRWPWPTADCTDFGSPRDKRAGVSLGAVVSCDQPASAVSSVAYDETPFQMGDIWIARSRSTTRSWRDPVRGVVALAEAEAGGIELGKLFGIGRVYSRAETWAKGRPGTARSSFASEFEDVWTRDAEGKRRVVCAAMCLESDVREALTQVFGTKARVDFPRPDPEAAAGTKGGYQALVVRKHAEQANEISLNDEAGIRNEVPAMVITVFADSRVRSRAVISLAAVSAESHYGIYRLGQPFPPDNGPGFLGSPGGFNPGGGVVRFPDPLPPVVGTPDVIKIVKKTFVGMRFLLGSRSHSIRAAGLWLFLAAPLLLLMRRRGLDISG